MLHRTLIFFTALFVVCGLVGYSLAANTGPAEMKLTSTDSTKNPPVVFPHKKHQDTLKCGECHHDIKDGKQAPYSEGQEIKKCESCHNAQVLAGKERGKNKLDAFKGAAHENCLGCHEEVAKNDPAKKELKSCKNCHQK